MKSPNEKSLSEIEDIASRWIARRDAGLGAADAAEYERWRSADPRHADAIARHEQAWTMVDHTIAAGGAMGMARELSQRYTRRRRRRLTRAMAAGSALLLAGFFWLAPWTSPLPPTAKTTAVVVLPEKQVLPDGTAIELKGGAEIIVDYGEAYRRVSLRKGEAHFQVMKDARRPFIVKVGAVEVRAVGTAFSVQLEKEEVEVLVTEGRVAVDRPPTPLAMTGQSHTEQVSGQPEVMQSVATRAPTYVDAGERYVIPVSTAMEASVRDAVAITRSELAERLAWRSARLEFTGTPLAEAVALMNLHAAGSGGPTLLIDPTETGLARLEVSGYFRASNIEIFLSLIEQTLGVATERSETTITLRRKH